MASKAINMTSLPTSSNPGYSQDTFEDESKSSVAPAAVASSALVSISEVHSQKYVPEAISSVNPSANATLKTIDVQLKGK